MNTEPIEARVIAASLEINRNFTGHEIRLVLENTVLSVTCSHTIAVTADSQLDSNRTPEKIKEGNFSVKVGVGLQSNALIKSNCS